MDGQIRARTRVTIVTTNGSQAQEANDILCSSPAMEIYYYVFTITSLTLFSIFCNTPDWQKKFTESDVHEHTRTSTFLFIVIGRYAPF